MASMPRIITIDPSSTIPRIVRSTMDLIDRSFILVDVPTGSEALEELNRGCKLIVTTFELEDNMKGFEFAMRVRRSSPDTAVIILGDVGDPDELDDETSVDSPFVYLSRPLDVHKFLRVFVAGLDSHEAMIGVLKPPASEAVTAPTNMGPVPTLDTNAARPIVDALLTDLGAMAIIMSSREGEVLMEVGAVGYIDREALTNAVLPIMMTNIRVKDLLGGQVTTVQLYDGEEYDVFVLSIGLHHFLCVMFDGQMGSRQFGGVNRFGRRAVEDLIALLGANAFFIQPPVVQEEEQEVLKPRSAAKHKVEDEGPIELAPADFAQDTQPVELEPALQLEAIPESDFDPDALFGGDVDVSFDLFDDPDKLEEIAKSSGQQGKVLDWDQAKQLGLINN